MLLVTAASALVKPLLLDFPPELRTGAALLLTYGVLWYLVTYWIKIRKYCY